MTANEHYLAALQRELKAHPDRKTDINVEIARVEQVIADENAVSAQVRAGAVASAKAAELAQEALEEEAAVDAPAEPEAAVEPETVKKPVRKTRARKAAR